MSKLEIQEHIEDLGFNQALSERYLSYALSVITSRSLPDVRDGLKPVHRRLLYAMLQLKLDPKSGFKKCARVVGDVIGKYHPHGDVAVYDTLVRLAQEFSLRYPLVEGQGNFGSIDGDNAAAMRYTEARLTEIALELLSDINKDTVNFRPTYDGSEIEPLLLPASFPNLLANGSEGIAVGMATSIPPHNLHELCDALLALIDNPAMSIEQIIKFIPGPDFPTGGIIIEPHASILAAYHTGRGAIKLRARWHQENLSHGLYQLVITEIPYQVDKSKLIEKIADLLKEKRLVLLGNIRDESAGEIRIVLEPKNRTYDPVMLMESLFKLTDLEVRINLNMNVLDKNSVPRVMNLKEVLQAFLEHRYEIVIRRSNFRLNQINDRLEILEGLIIAYLNLDEIIRIIREEDDAKQIMIDKFNLTDPQVEAILNMRLRSLRKLEEVEIREECTKLNLEKDVLLKIISNEKECWKVISSELKNVRTKFGSKNPLGTRRTHFEEVKIPEQIITIDPFIEREPITISCSTMGWIRAVKGHSDDAKEMKYKEGDQGKYILQAFTTDKLIIFTSSGRSFTIQCDKIAKGKGYGDPIRLMVDIANDDDIVAIVTYKGGRKLLAVTYHARGLLLEEEELLAQTRTGKQILNLKTNDRALFLEEIQGEYIAIMGENRKLLIFKIDEVPIGKRGQGVTLQKYRNGGVSLVRSFSKENGLPWGTGIINSASIMDWLGNRGTIGRLPPRSFPSN
jgi:topoisomerase-4 subunit A